jgi:hypothetical protein
VKTTFKLKINLKRNPLNFKSIQSNHLQAFPIWWDYPFKFFAVGSSACFLCTAGDRAEEWGPPKCAIPLSITWLRLEVLAPRGGGGGPL